MEKHRREKEQLKRLLGNFYDVLRDYECILAGGAITSLFIRGEINDFDIYFRSKELLADFLYNEMEHKWVVAHTDKSILFKVEDKKIQAIAFRYFEDAHEIFESFDFTVCMGAFDFKTEEFVFHEDFFTHNAQRILIFNERTAFPIISALRVNKYKDKGYYISKTEFVRLLLTAHEAQITDYDTLVEQIGGMYGESYDKWIQKQDDFSMAGVISDLKNVEAGAEKCADTVISNWDEFIFDITGFRAKATCLRGNIYIMKNGSLCAYYGDKSKIDLVDTQSLIPMPQYYYKYVEKRDDGRYYSYYEKTFEYELGETVVARNSAGLFAAQKDSAPCAQYNDHNGATLIRLRVDDIEDVINPSCVFDGTIQLKKAVFEEVVGDSTTKHTATCCSNSPY